MLNYQTGWIEVICGSMFSGKTEELIRRIRRANIARQRVILFKPEIDNRYAESLVISHSQQKIEAIVARNTQDIIEKSRGYEVVGIDEAQFFGLSLVETCQTLADEGKRVIVSGLDQDYKGKPFEPIPQLLAIAEYITKNLAICMRCGNPANRNQRLSNHKQRVMLGGHDSYEARCRRCHSVSPNSKTNTPEAQTEKHDTLKA
ncbi:MAG TPA: thymidine kinase [Oligoflexia bacterium]|nr:thymidine kinase [Oligoflexia bacterium]HMR24716.1 thymidine kinase [Oligoflexia bacterium]